MTEPFYFGDSPRSLFGILHPAIARQKKALLACPPLFQDAIRSHRALWQLAESLSEAGIDTLRFDWFGTGDSSGESQELVFDGMLDDLLAAREMLTTMSGATLTRMLALRSSALPLLMHAAAQSAPVDLVLWDPCLDGKAVVADWRAQQTRQMAEAGRYVYRTSVPDRDELLGFTVNDELLASIEALDLSRTPLPHGSRVLLAVWATSAPVEQALVERFIETQRTAGAVVECLQFDTAEAPPFDAPRLFEAQIFPRRSLSQLMERMVEGAWS
jgi:hypothetical protein